MLGWGCCQAHEGRWALLVPGGTWVSRLIAVPHRPGLCEAKGRTRWLRYHEDSALGFPLLCGNQRSTSP